MNIDRSRREFVSQLSRLASLVAACPAPVLAAMRERHSEAAAWKLKDPWLTLAAVQRHLLPSTEDVPGADDIGAIVYLKNAIDAGAVEEDRRQFLLDGVGWLNDLTQTDMQQPFVALNATAAEQALRKIEHSRAGRRWLLRMLSYLIEALLADPAYGGNTDGVGWRWLQHQPGFPHPPDGKLWYQLQRRRYGDGKA